jgi:hypothetical protein
MHFFHSQEAAVSWLKAHPGVAVLSIDEAWQLAYTVWIEPLAELNWSYLFGLTRCQLTHNFRRTKRPTAI